MLYFQILIPKGRFRIYYAFDCVQKGAKINNFVCYIGFYTFADISFDCLHGNIYRATERATEQACLLACSLACSVNLPCKKLELMLANLPNIFFFINFTHVQKGAKIYNFVCYIGTCTFANISFDCLHSNIYRATERATEQACFLACSLACSVIFTEQPSEPATERAS